MTASEARALVKESSICKEISLYNDIDNKIREVASKGISLCDFDIENPKDNQLLDICRHYRNLGFTSTFRIHNRFNELGYVIAVGTIYLSWVEVCHDY